MNKSEMQVRFILKQAGVPDTEGDACIFWAFGPDAWTIPIYPDWINRWNKLHPTAFRALPKDKFVEFVYVVGYNYEMEKRKTAAKRAGLVNLN